MKDTRPVNLDLGSLKYPPMAIASLLHRISGIVLFLLMPVMLCFLGQSLKSLESFEALRMDWGSPWAKLILWAFAAAWVYHVLAGIRHITMDLGLGETVCAGRRSAIIVLILAIVSIILLGMWIW